MVKIVKIIGRIIGISLEWVLILLILFLFGIRSEKFQSFLADRATEYLSNELNTTVHVSAVDIIFFDELALDDVLVKDLKKDTLLSVASIRVRIDRIKFWRKKIKISDITIQNGYANVHNTRKNRDFNFQFLVDYFSSDTPPSKNDPFDLDIKTLALKEMRIKYHDYASLPGGFGFDANHLDLAHLNLKIEDIIYRKSITSLKIASLQLEERAAGLNLKKFRGLLTIHDTSVELKAVKIALNGSRLNAKKIGFSWNNEKDLNDFLNKVIWDIQLNPSSVLLSDIAIFAPDMEGMRDRIKIKGNAGNTLNHLILRDIELNYKQNTKIIADLELPDFSDFSAYDFKEHIRYAKLDMAELQQFFLPYPNKQLDLGSEASALGTVYLNNFNANGVNGKWWIGKSKISTSIGDLKIAQTYSIDEWEDGFNSHPFQSDSAAFQLLNFDLGKLINLSDIGIVNGAISFKKFTWFKGSPEINQINATLTNTDLLDYKYALIKIKNGQLKEESFNGLIEVDDKNLDVSINGKVNYGAKPSYSLDMDIKKCFLGALGFTSVQETSLKASMTVNAKSFNLSDMSGSIQINDLSYIESGRDLKVPYAKVIIERGKTSDLLDIESSLGNIRIDGKVNPSTVGQDFMHELAKIFPTAGTHLSMSNGEVQNKFTYSIEIKDLSDFLPIFLPELSIESGTIVKGMFDSGSNKLELNLNANKIIFDSMVFEGIDLDQKVDRSGILAEYNISKFNYSDSLAFSDVHFKSKGSKGDLESELSWDPNSSNYSKLSWETLILENDYLDFKLKPSFISINDIKWNINDESNITYTSKDISVQKLRINRGNQVISVNGCLSKNESDQLRLDLQQINLAELSSMLKLEVKLAGTFSGFANITNPYDNLGYTGDAIVEQLYVDGEEVGNVAFNLDYFAKQERIRLDGNLEYKNQKTLDFQGFYYLEREKDNLDFALLFKNTDLKFTNAFMDPEVVKGIEGKINGKIVVKGSPDHPLLSGKLKLQNAAANIELLGVRYTLNGEVEVVEDAFYINNLPVKDEDGNTASLVGQIYHKNFDKWDYNMNFNFEDDLTKRDPQAPYRNLPLERFLVMKTTYKQGDYYYGKAYARGTANISGYGNKMDVTVDVETKTGTLITFPMYGASDLDEEENFIQFVSKTDPLANLKEKIDFTGVNLDMKFKITPEATLKIVFNEQLNDEILAYGSGDIDFTFDAYNNMYLEGKYTLTKGSNYNFAMGPIKQKFDILDGSKIEWSGDIYNANIELNTAFTIKKVSILELSPEQEDKSLLNQDIVCLLKLRETLLKPTIQFEIQAPKAPETGKALITKVNAENDELNRQFFSLLLVKKFQPLKGTVSASGSAALDLVESQINVLLGQLSKDYKVNVDLGDNNALASVQKNFIGDRLIVTGSFGVESAALSGQSNGAFVGDVNLEYLVNKNGTFRVNAFNQSNSNTVKENTGPFTQGAGLSYHEDFNTSRDFVLWQSFLDVFRQKENKFVPEKKKKKQTKVPIIGVKDSTVPQVKSKERK